jgi:hypothetical protein
MNSFESQAFEAIVAAHSAEEAMNLALKNPVVFSESLWPDFLAWAKTQRDDLQSRANGIVATLLPGLVKEGSEHWYRYPFGPGPLDAILQKFSTGEIDQRQAEQIASAPEVLRNLSPVYVRARLMQYVNDALNGPWSTPLQCQRVILAAIDARKAMLTRDQEVMAYIGAIEYAAVAKECIGDTADGRVLRDAAARVKSVLGYDARPWATPGQAEYALGQLYLDPYMHNRNSINFKQHIDAWMRLPFERIGHQLTDDIARELRVPPPLEAFTDASRYFLASAKVETGAQRGLSLKGYIEAEVWKKIAGGSVDDLSAYAEEARRLLTEEKYTEPRAAIDSLMRFATQNAKQPAPTANWRKTAQDLVAGDTSKLVARDGLDNATHLMIQVADSVRSQDPGLALAVWRKTLPWMLQRDEGAVPAFLQTGVSMILDALADPEVRKWKFDSGFAANASRFLTGRATPKTPLDASKEVERRAQVEQWSAEKLVATLLWIATASQITDRDLDGAELVKRARSVSDDLAREWQPVFLWLLALLHRGEASNRFKANDYDKSMREYALCALYLLEAHLPSQAVDALEQGADLVHREPARVASFVTYFEIVIPELERQGGNAIVSRLRDLGREFFHLAVKESPAIPRLMLSMLKGVLLTRAWNGGGQLDWLDSDESRAQLARIEEIRRQVPGGIAVEDSGGLGMEDLLTVFAEDTETASGDSASAALHNLEVQFDTALRDQITRRRGQQTEWVQTPDKIAGALPPETVLLNYYSGILPNGNAGLYIDIFTGHSATLGMIDIGLPGMQMTLGNSPADILAFLVSAMRRDIQKPPSKNGEDQSNPEAQDPFLAGPTEGVLRQFNNAGKWHLCVVPHGPCHFLPFHLLPYNGGFLGDEWAVTYLPAVGLLEPRPAPTSTRTKKIASFGLDFKDHQPHGLPEIPGSEQEAQAVASIFKESAFTAADATLSAVHDALNNAQYVHLSTHGAFTASAPSFQRVYLAPDPSSDGILYGWEILRHDLRGLDLLTLSACETALGRIDKGDNLRGLAANTLIAGARTIIGTLWQVGSGVTQIFFESFYREIASGAGKREAFHTAQLIAREKFPESSDWGAFWYIGLW